MNVGELRAPLPGVRRPFRLPGGLATTAVAVAGAVAFAVVAVRYPEHYRWALMLALTANLVIVASRWPRLAVVITLLWLPVMGIVRRVLIADSGWSDNDPLLLVGPLVALFLIYRLAFVEGARLLDDRLAKLVAALLAIAVIQAVNPLGIGGPGAGLAGFLFLGVPLLWFFIGREVPDRRTIGFLVPAIIVMAVLVGAYGIFQTEIYLDDKGALPSYDQDWFDVAGYQALQAGDTSNNSLRPFSTFASNAEYCAFVAIGMLFAFALFMHRRYVAVLAAAPLIFAVFFASGRAVLALSMIAATILLGLKTRHGAAGLLVVLVGLGLIYGVVAAVGPALDRAAGVSGDVIVERQVTGLVNPLDPSKSTFLGHWENLVGGVEDGFSNPIGEGLGATTLGAKLGSGGGGRETDMDVSDVFVSFGALGGLLFIAVIVLAFRNVFRRYVRTRDVLVFAVAGLMIVTFTQWLNGGHWATATYTWFFIGWASRPIGDGGAGPSEDQPEP